MSPEGCCQLLEFQVCWQRISRTRCSNSERSVAYLAVCSWDDEVADSFHTKKLCSRLSSTEVRFCTENGRFEPPLRGLGAKYDDHGLIEKRVVDFLLVLIELFSLGATA